MTTSDDMDHSSGRSPHTWLADVGTGVRNSSVLDKKKRCRCLTLFGDL